MAARDLTHGSIPRLLVRLAVPGFASFGLQSLYQLVDLYFVGLLGGVSIAGMSIALNTFFITLAVGMTFGIGGLALISQAYGRGERELVPVLFQQVLWLAGGAGAALWLVGYLAAEPFVAFFTDDPAVLTAGTAFFRVFAATMFTNVLLLVATFQFRAVGDFVTPMVLIAVGVVLNTALDPLLIFGWGPVPGMGATGAALATALTQGMGLAAVAWLVLRRGGSHVLRLRRPVVLRPELMLRILRIGLPSGAQFMLFAVALFVTYRIARPYGGDATAALGVGFRVMEAGILPVVAIGQAVSSLVGQNFGARRFARVRATALWGIAYCGVIVAVEFALLAWHPAFWVALFTDDAGVQTIGAEYLRIVGISLLLIGPAHPIVCLGMGLGRTLLALVGQCIRLAAFLAALVLLVGMWRQGLSGLFWSRTVSLLPELTFLAGVMVYWWRTVLREPPGPV